MSTRTALLFASAALLAAATPALAQDDRYRGIHDAAAQEARDAAEDAEDAAYRAARAGDQAQMHHADMRQADMRQGGTHRFAYTAEQREAWLADCQTVMRGEDYYQAAYAEEADDDNDRGGLLGGLIGSVLGGVAGNRIGGAGDRLAGTLLGVGIGGVAGAVLGSVISGDGDRDDYDESDYGSTEATDAYAADYCAAYLRQYEASGSTGQYVTAYAQPVMMMQSRQHSGGTIRERITEEWVEAPAEYVEVREVRHHRRPARRAAPQRGKLTPAN